MSSDPARTKAVKSYWAAMQGWAEMQGIEKEEAHKRFKEIMKFDHLKDLKTSRIMDIAFEISTMVAGGPGL